MAFAKIFFIGNVGRDPETRYTPSGKSVTDLNVAVSHSKPDGHGGWEDEGTDWFKVSIWGERGEGVAQRIKKGNKVLVSGRFKSREYETKDGRKGVSLEVSADDVIEVGKKSEGSSAPREDRAAVSSDEVDDLPF